MVITLPPPAESLVSTNGQTWQVTRCTDLPSTNTAAAKLPPWHAVIAHSQSNGYGRTGATWVSDIGGLWLSAVLPFPQGNSQWSLLPLVVGCTLAETLAQMGLKGHHLRWPNDLLVGRKKIAGVLVERFSPETAVVGIGLNVLNDPARRDSTLVDQVTSLSQHWNYPRTLREVSEKVLSDLAAAHQRFSESGFEPFARAINLHWTHPSKIEYKSLDHALPQVSRLVGIDIEGRLEVIDAQGHLLHLDPLRISGLRELAS